VVDEADRAVRLILQAYENENTTFSDIIHSINKGLVDPLRPFSEACHEELRTY